MELFGLGKKKNKQEEYDYIYNNSKSNSELFEPDIGEVYDDVYDEDGYYVICACGGEIKWKDGIYICPHCGLTMNRSEFFNYIGAEPPGPECITCNNLYPGCVICRHGYIED